MLPRYCTHRRFYQPVTASRYCWVPSNSYQWSGRRMMHDHTGSILVQYISTNGSHDIITTNEFATHTTHTSSIEAISTHHRIVDTCLSNLLTRTQERFFKPSSKMHTMIWRFEILLLMYSPWWISVLYYSLLSLDIFRLRTSSWGTQVR